MRRSNFVRELRNVFLRMRNIHARTPGSCKGNRTGAWPTLRTLERRVCRVEKRFCRGSCGDAIASQSTIAPPLGAIYKEWPVGSDFDSAEPRHFRHHQKHTS
jgi:hypothetical protein